MTWKFNPFIGNLDYYESGIPDAPSDTHLYARCDGAWSAFTIPDGFSLGSQVGGATGGHLLFDDYGGVLREGPAYDCTTGTLTMSGDICASPYNIAAGTFCGDGSSLNGCAASFAVGCSFQAFTAGCDFNSFFQNGANYSCDFLTAHDLGTNCNRVGVVYACGLNIDVWSEPSCACPGEIIFNTCSNRLERWDGCYWDGVPTNYADCAGYACCAGYAYCGPWPCYSFSESVTECGGTVALCGDSSWPGGCCYYGTDGNGNKGWIQFCAATYYCCYFDCYNDYYDCYYCCYYNCSAGCYNSIQLSDGSCNFMALYPSAGFLYWNGSYYSWCDPTCGCSDMYCWYSNNSWSCYTPCSFLQCGSDLSSSYADGIYLGNLGCWVDGEIENYLCCRGYLTSCSDLVWNNVGSVAMGDVEYTVSMLESCIGALQALASVSTYTGNLNDSNYNTIAYIQNGLITTTYY